MGVGPTGWGRPPARHGRVSMTCGLAFNRRAERPEPRQGLTSGVRPMVVAADDCSSRACPLIQSLRSGIPSRSDLPPTVFPGPPVDGRCGLCARHADRVRIPDHVAEKTKWLLGRPDCAIVTARFEEAVSWPRSLDFKRRPDSLTPSGWRCEPGFQQKGCPAEYQGKLHTCWRACAPQSYCCSAPP